MHYVVEERIHRSGEERRVERLRGLPLKFHFLKVNMGGGGGDPKGKYGRGRRGEEGRGGVGVEGRGGVVVEGRGGVGMEGRNRAEGQGR